MNYFMIGGDKREYGPVDAELIRQWLREGRANGETLLRAEGETEWKPLRTFADFSISAPPLIGSAPSVAPADERIEPADVSIGPIHCFARAWHLIGAHFGIIAGATLLVWFVLTAIGLSSQIGAYAAMLLEGPLYGGLFVLFLKLIRDGQATFAEVAVSVRDNAASLMITWLAVTLVSAAGLICCCFIPGIYLYIAWILALPLVADRSVGFWQGMELSRRVVTGQWFTFFALFLLSFLPTLVFGSYLFYRIMSDAMPHIVEFISNHAPTPAQAQQFQAQMMQIIQAYAPWALIKQALVLITLPFGIGSLAFAYEDIFGRRR
jgi:hypothetical protein